MSLAGREGREFPLEMARLSLWYVRRLLERGEIRAGEIPRALARRVDIYRSTRLYDGKRDPAFGHVDAEWDRVTAELAEIVRSGNDVEERGLAVLRGLLLPDAKPYAPLGERTFGCWTYEMAWEGYADGDGRLAKLANPGRWIARARKAAGLPRLPPRNAALHFANAMMPETPFDHMPELAKTLAQLVADCHVRYPQVERLWCGTWLNSHPKFRQLFPEAWHRNARLQPPGNSGNWWGQFQSRTGGFHYAMAEKFRASGGEFPFPALMGHARLDEIAEYLKQRFPV